MSVSMVVVVVVRECEGKTLNPGYLLTLKGGPPTRVVGHGAVGSLELHSVEKQWAVYSQTTINNLPTFNHSITNSASLCVTRRSGGAFCSVIPHSSSSAL